ncbi:MAG: hypothetical protein Q7T50_05420 [Candidatus Magasanikbacteria bacterium]|nr:hypothetical protein [Candidatus Magasanikbacteria bacterium]
MRFTIYFIVLFVFSSISFTTVFERGKATPAKAPAETKYVEPSMKAVRRRGFEMPRYNSAKFFRRYF